MLSPLKTITSKDFDTQKLQNNVEEFCRDLLTNPLTQGKVLEDVSLASTNDNVIYHNLNRDPVGYIVIKKSANANVWDLQARNTNSRKSLVLKASANVIVSIFVF